MDGLIELEETPSGSDDPVVLPGELFILFWLTVVWRRSRVFVEENRW